MERYRRGMRTLALAIRRMARRPLYASLVALCLATGVGSATAVWTVVHRVVLRPLPFPDPGGLYDVASYSLDREDPAQRYWISLVAWERVRRDVDAFAGVGGFVFAELDVMEDGRARRVRGARVAPGSFEVLGVRPLLGRTIDEGDFRAARRVALISEGLWKTRFGGRPDVLERQIVVGGLRHEIVGVLPGWVRYPDRAELWIGLLEEDYTERERLGAGMIHVVARLAPGAEPADLRGQLERVQEGLEGDHAGFFSGVGLESWPLDRVWTGDYRDPLVALLVASLLVLAVAVANVGSLLLVRAQGESGAVAVRRALGAGCWDVCRDALAENLVLAGVGGGVGLVGAWVGLPVLLSLSPVDDQAFDGLGLGPSSVLVALVVSAGAAGIMTLLAYRHHERAWTSAVPLSREGAAGSREARRVQRLFVTAQIAVSLVLVVGAALTARSVGNLRAMDPGFRPEGLVSLRVSAPPSLAGTHEGRVAFVADVEERIRALPGVESASSSQRLPLHDPDWAYGFSLADHPPLDPNHREWAAGLVVRPGYFETLGIPLLKGRTFAESDRLDAPGVAVVSRAFQERYFPERSAVGRRLKRGAFNGDRPWMEIVGVVDDVRSAGLGQAPGPALYYPMPQIDNGYLSVMVVSARVTGEPLPFVPLFRQAVREVAPTATAFDPVTGPQVVREALGGARFNGVVVLIFAAAGILLALAGAYGLTAYSVGRRTRELALRMALGAESRGVVRLVLKCELGTALRGVAAGAVVAAILARLLTSTLFQVQPLDPAVYAGTAAGLLGASLLASWIPALRATRICPVQALKEE